jgi:hypothetical protein
LSKALTSSGMEERLRLEKLIVESYEELKRIKQEFDQHLEDFHANADRE